MCSIMLTIIRFPYTFVWVSSNFVRSWDQYNLIQYLKKLHIVYEYGKLAWSFTTHHFNLTNS